MRRQCSDDPSHPSFCEGPSRANKPSYGILSNRHRQIHKDDGSLVWRTVLNHNREHSKSMRINKKGSFSPQHSV